MTAAEADSEILCFLTKEDQEYGLTKSALPNKLGFIIFFFCFYMLMT
jgi:hypothetical protein